MSLRSFKSLSASAPVVLFTHPVSLANFDGSTGAAGYIQFFDSDTAPTPGDVPVKSFLVATVGPLPSVFATAGPLPFQVGLVVALSSTDGTYTAQAGTFSIFGEVEEWEYPVSPPFMTSATPIREAVNADIASVWSDGNGASRRLLSATVLNGEGATRYIMLFATDDPQDGDFPIASWPVVNSETKYLHFGNDGLTLKTFEADGTAHDGCTLVISTTAASLTRSTDAGCTINANYR